MTDIDTKLAKDFLKKNTSVINTVKSGNYDKISAEMMTCFNKEIKNLPREEKMLLFASKMEENAELFAQLEALLRDVPKEDVINIDKKLIVQCFKYWTSIYPVKCNYCRPGYNPYSIEMTESSPLVELGAVVCGIKFGINVKIHCCDVTAPLCILFVRLCLEAGIERVHLFHQKEKVADNRVDFKNGCSAVVTEHSDMDSAIDMVLSDSSSKRPWKLRHLFVQESEIERFRNTLIDKCKMKGYNIKNTGVAYENKLFAFDYEDKPDGKHVKTSKYFSEIIIVEAYRTVEDLLALIKKENPFFLSLWTEDISEAYEIAYNVTLPIVWINDYGIFDGPDISSQAFYSAYFLVSYSIDNIDLMTVRELDNLQNWSVMNIKERVMKIMNVVEVLKAEKNPDVESIALIEDAVTNLESNKFVDMERVCVRIGDLRGIHSIVFLDSDSNMKKVVTSLVYGAGCIQKLESIPEKKSKILKLFQEENIPYMETDTVFKHVVYGELYSNDDIRALPLTRVIHTSFGAIFAK